MIQPGSNNLCGCEFLKMTNKICVYLFDGFADWEIAYLSPEIKKNSQFELIYFTKDGNPVTSMGGLQVYPDTSLSKISKDGIDLLILPGGSAWETCENPEIEDLIKSLFESGTTIAAICAATAYLAQKGFLNDTKHTSNSLAYLRAIAPEYRGESNYKDQYVVADKYLITASGVAPVEFARAIFERLSLYNKEYIHRWYQLFKHGIWSE